MTRSICLVSTGQPSTNPRMVKEADALAGAGYDVRVVGVYSSAWADREDGPLLRRRPWRFEMLDWRRERAPIMFWRTGIRQRVCRLAAARPWIPLMWAEGSESRMSRELADAVGREPADLFVAHNLGALPAAARASVRHNAGLVFDAEDFHSGQCADPSDGRCVLRRRLEAAYIPRCDLITASSPDIARAYASLGRRPPVIVLNVADVDHALPPSCAASEERGLGLYWFSQTIGPDRGLEDAVQAMAELNPDVYLFLRGTWADGYERHLRGLAGRAGLGEQQIRSGPPVNPDALIADAAAHDVGLALEPGTSRNNDGAISNKVFTYLAGGLAIAASGTSGQKWLMGNVPDAGFVYRPGQAAELAVGLRRWHADRTVLDRARAASRHAGCKRFNWSHEQRVWLTSIDATLRARGAEAVDGLSQGMPRGGGRVSSVPSSDKARA